MDINRGSDSFSPGALTYNIDVSPVPGSGVQFNARCRESGIEVISADPERSVCLEMVKKGWEDRPVQTWLGGVPSLHHPSMYRWAYPPPPKKKASRVATNGF